MVNNLSSFLLEAPNVVNGFCQEQNNLLAIPEPLEIRLTIGKRGERKIRNVSVTIGTSSHDAELAAGFLFTEGIIASAAEIRKTGVLQFSYTENKKNRILIDLQHWVLLILKNTERNFDTKYSCRVCGKGFIVSMRTVSLFADTYLYNEFCIPDQLLYTLTNLLYKRQEVFQTTGGINASAIFYIEGERLLLQEEIGRHDDGKKCVPRLFVIVAYPIPSRNTVTSFPETNVLVSINNTVGESNTPASKRVIIKIKKHAGTT